MTLQAKSATDIRLERRRTPTRGGLLTVAALWPKTGENLGTLARSCDAVGARLVVPDGARAVQALRRGNTIGLHNTVWQSVPDPMRWLAASGTWRVAVELVEDAKALIDLQPAVVPTTIVLGNENSGIPDEALAWCHAAVEIPMHGVGSSLNVAIAGSLVLYKLAGLA